MNGQVGSCNDLDLKLVLLSFLRNWFQVGLKSEARRGERREQRKFANNTPIRITYRLEGLRGVCYSKMDKRKGWT